MGYLIYFLMSLLGFVSLLLIAIILLQRGRGGGLAGALGGAGGQSTFGVKAGDLFTRITIGMAAAWFVLAAICVLLMSRPLYTDGANVKAKATDSALTDPLNKPADPETPAQTAPAGSTTPAAPAGGTTAPAAATPAATDPAAVTPAKPETPAATDAPAATVTPPADAPKTETPATTPAEATPPAATPAPTTTDAATPAPSETPQP
ncbi:MAG: preprotein translocase subunit SecG [Planctomyces sp.]|nr:preprotein translocase subunit SecG [Planctomyces sp.]